MSKTYSYFSRLRNRPSRPKASRPSAPGTTKIVRFAPVAAEPSHEAIPALAAVGPSTDF